MYVCVCNAIRERDIKRALHCGVRTVAEIYKFLGHKPECGKCVPHTVKMVKEHRREVARSNGMQEAAD